MSTPVTPSTDAKVGEPILQVPVDPTSQTPVNPAPQAPVDPTSQAPVDPAPQALVVNPQPPDLPVSEVVTFNKDCDQRYHFNSRWDNVLNVAGMLLSVAIIAAGVFKMAEIAAILGGFVAAIVSAQRAFPFGQRAQFYRSLIGQSENLLTDAKLGLLTTREFAVTLKTLRLDFAQQLPRGTSFRTESTSDSGNSTNQGS